MKLVAHLKDTEARLAGLVAALRRVADQAEARPAWEAGFRNFSVAAVVQS